MIDLHTHILPGVDDGVKSYQEALMVIKEAERQGIKKMVATPHDDYQSNMKKIKEKVAKLQAMINKEGLDVQVLIGAETYLTPELRERAAKGLVNTINDSRYLLLELPFGHLPNYIDDVFYDLQVLGYIPIICHPERYRWVREEPNYLYNWVKQGICFQLNAGSLLGQFGSKVQETAEILVKHNLVQLIGSDVHSIDNRGICLEQGVKRLKGLVGNDVKFYLQNAGLVINDEEVECVAPKYYKKTVKVFDNFFVNKLKTALGWR
ncbi:MULTISPECIES: tyrosine-protein phosphatase [unclassified Candidatus Frackibacter]|uniref:tyrosine-protein phosphatase n=1 Tax=unclassified Candidatus Frackibacter TaxID=2648818 RepID=UPI00088064B9|nr:MULTISPECIES: CpsB/CapC family capsule biosynthesis tyrosine phosphatase [unclassified Candidatus Frackibacter]SDC08223.1 protein-tyrosine phosphatase [Candidatus Frackibacter sp. WG11]SEM38409.1 protein-tyrosine phosphatase [Candidatus Frackibacter sp. WG12]SFL44028.1 protein-tyrosine phosphatase [Candidatus Frackibacter sp. WG13]